MYTRGKTLSLSYRSPPDYGSPTRSASPPSVGRCRPRPTTAATTGTDVLRSRVDSLNADRSLASESRPFRRAVAVGPRDRGEARLVSVSLESGPKNETETGRADGVRVPSVTRWRASRQRGPKRRVRGYVHAVEGRLGRVSESVLRENGQRRYFCEPDAASSGLVGTPCGMNASGSVPTPSPSWTFEPACSAMPAPSS